MQEAAVIRQNSKSTVWFSWLLNSMMSSIQIPEGPVSIIIIHSTMKTPPQEESDAFLRHTLQYYTVHTHPPK